MKIRKLKSKQILSLYLLKSKTYDSHISKKNISSSFIKSYFSETLTSFKKALNIIFQYHKKNKLILFIGLPENLRIKINKSTCHVAVSKFVNLKGVNFNVSKNGNFFKNNKKKPYLIILIDHTNIKGVNFNVAKNGNYFKNSKKPYLIVLIDHINLEEIIQESYLAKIPLICINGISEKYSFAHINYKVSLHHNQFQSLQNLFFIGLNFLFK